MARVFPEALSRSGGLGRRRPGGAGRRLLLQAAGYMVFIKNFFKEQDRKHSSLKTHGIIMAKRKKLTHTSSGRTNIAGHKKHGSKLTPPLATLPNLDFQSWKDDRLPEMLWSALIVSRFDQMTALLLMAQSIEFLVEKDLEFESTNDKSSVSIDFDVTHTGLSQMDPEVLHGFLSELTPNEKMCAVLRPLLLFDDLPAREMWVEALKMEPEPHDWNHLMQAVTLTLDHQSQEATDCRYVRLMAVIAGGGLRFTHETKHILDKLLAYPNVDLREVGPRIRANEIALGKMFPILGSHDWPNKFWGQCLRDTECWPLHVEVASAEAPKIKSTLSRVQEVKTLLIDHCNRKRPSSAVDPRYDTVLGIGLYSLNLLDDLLRVDMGNTVSARFCLRSLVENLITLAYLAHKDDMQLWQSYRVFGAGQAKLQYLKLEDEPTRPTYVNVDTLQRLANEDVWEEFLPIELGHWEKSNIRKMSEEAGVKEIYDKFYGWTSTYSHGHWGAIRDTVFDTCGNPLYRLHRIPRASPQSLPDVVPDATVCG